MKTMGIIRKADEQGRLVIPKPIRKELNWNKDTPLEISFDGENIFVRKHEKVCVLCGGVGDVALFENKPICKGCIAKLQK